MTVDVRTGTAAGVPYLAVPPAGGARPDAPVVVAWHLMDAPRTERALAAALPLDGLDAWRIYLGLPLSGARSPGDEELTALAMADPVLHVHDAVNAQAVAEFPAAWAGLRGALGLGDGPVGLLGGSAGAGVAGAVAVRERAGDGAGLDLRAAVLVCPLVALRPVVAHLGTLYGIDYAWGPASDAAADRMDLVARAGELGDLPVRLVLGADDADAINAPAAALHAALPYADLVTVDGMAHALAEEPGVEPAPPTPHARVVDGHAVAWFRRHLTGARSPSPGRG